MKESLGLRGDLGEIHDVGLGQAGGYTRLSFTGEDLQLSNYFETTARELGMTVVRDTATNVWAWYGDPDAHPDDNIVLGSHLDSVPEGGPLDGPLGVFAALRVAHYVARQGGLRRGAIGVVNFREEEGARFGVACLGSKVLTGSYATEQALALCDADGASMLDAMSRQGFPELAPDPKACQRIGRYIELHIEQGHQLREYGSAVGIGSFIWPHGRWCARFSGVANHAGTTPLDEREDPILKMAQAMLAGRSRAAELGALVTFGKISAFPASVNGIAKAAEMYIDARAESEETLESLIDSLRSNKEVAEFVEVSLTKRTKFAPKLVEEISAILPGAPVIATGAGHDAGVLAAAGYRSGMLFVRNPTGVSHSPSENATDEDIDAGVKALAHVVKGLAG